jgi:hypothetical protein
VERERLAIYKAWRHFAREERTHPRWIRDRFGLKFEVELALRGRQGDGGVHFADGTPKIHDGERCVSPRPD